MIDFHTHILPGIDDGSQCINDTRQLLWQEHEQGVRHILATPHFYAEKESADLFFCKREKAVEAVRELAEEESWLPEVRVAAELHYFPGIGEAGILPRLCMEGSNVLLLEMPFVQWTGSMYRDVEAAVRKRGMGVVLAHVERYSGLQKDKGVWNALFELPLYAQINAGSFLRIGVRSFALKFMKAGHKVLLGSDCHHPLHRPVNLRAGREAIEKKLGPEALGRVDMLGKELWNHAK